MAARTIVLTGAAGFIGSHVAEALVARGDHVVGIDNFDEFYDPALKERNVAALVAGPRFDLVTGDVRDAKMVRAVLREHAPDVIVHLAARAGVRPSIEDPVLYSSVNVMGTAVLLDEAERAGIRQLVLASSSSVYGATSQAPFAETEVADAPSSPYAATKRANEMQAYAHHHLYGADITCLRFFTVYGPRQRPEMAIHKFARAIADGREVPVFGDGTTRRDYTFIADIVAGVLASIDRPRGFRVYNLGTTDTTELRALVSKIGSGLGVAPRIKHHPLQDGDVPLTHADISLAAQELGYRPTTLIDEGLEVFLRWFRQDYQSAAYSARKAG